MFKQGQLCPEDLPPEVWAAVAANYSATQWKPSPSYHAEYRDARTAVEAYKKGAMTTDLQLKAAPDARCPMCRSLLIGMSGTHEFKTFPQEHGRFDLFGDGIGVDVTTYPPAAVQDFIATFAPCGCEWRARGRHGLLPYILLITGTDAGATFAIGERGEHEQHVMCVMTYERTQKT